MAPTVLAKVKKGKKPAHKSLFPTWSYTSIHTNPHSPKKITKSLTSCSSTSESSHSKEYSNLRIPPQLSIKEYDSTRVLSLPNGVFSKKALQTIVDLNKHYWVDIVCKDGQYIHVPSFREEPSPNWANFIFLEEDPDTKQDTPIQPEGSSNHPAADHPQINDTIVNHLQTTYLDGNHEQQDPSVSFASVISRTTPHTTFYDQITEGGTLQAPRPEVVYPIHISSPSRAISSKQAGILKSLHNKLPPRQPLQASPDPGSSKALQCTNKPSPLVHGYLPLELWAQPLDLIKGPLCNLVLQ